MHRLRSQRHAHRRRDADGRRAPHFQVADRFGHGPIIPAIQKLDVLRQPALVQQPHRPIFPFNGWKHKSRTRETRDLRDERDW